MLEHVGNPFGLASAFFGAGDFGNEERLVDACECLVGVVKDLRKGFPAGPALALAPVVSVNGDVIDELVAGVIACERGALAVVRDVRGPDPLDVLHVFFAENLDDAAERFGDIGIGIPGAFLAHAPVVPVAVRFVQRAQPDFFAVVLDALRKLTDVVVRFAVYNFLGVVAVRHPGDNQRGAVVLGDVRINLYLLPVVHVKDGEIADEVELAALQILEGLHVLFCGLRILSGASDPSTDLERHRRNRCDAKRHEKLVVHKDPVIFVTLKRYAESFRRFRTKAHKKFKVLLVFFYIFKKECFGKGT